MIRNVLILGTLTICLAACEQQAGEPVERIELGEPGPAVTPEEPEVAPVETVAIDSACREVSFEDVPLTHCVADPAEHRITTKLGEPDSPYRALDALQEAVDADDVGFAMNAGMFDEQGRPIGYYVENGERLVELNRNDGPGNFHMLPNGVFFGNGDRWRVLSTEQFYSTVRDRPQFGTQSGPMLVIDGELHPDFQDNGPSRAIRNGVGIDSEGKAHFVISEAPISFGQLARYYRDELNVANALYLDGNVSALWDPAAGRMDASAQLGPFVVVEKK